MKKLLAGMIAFVLVFTAIVPAGFNTAYAGISVVDSAQTAVKKNMELFLQALKKTEVTEDFTQEDLEDILYGACEYSANAYVGTAFMVEKFRIVSPTDSKPGKMSAVVWIYQDDAEEALEVEKEISASGGDAKTSEDVTVKTGDEEADEEPEYSDAEISAMKKRIAAAKSSINAAIWDFDVSNDTTLNDILNMAKSALPDGSDVTVTLDKANFKLTKATTTVNGTVSASLTLSCGNITEPLPIGKTIEVVVTEESTKIDEDRSAISKAIGKLSYTNKTTKEEMLKTALAAAKNGSSVVWRDNFLKKNATYQEDGEIFGYLDITFGSETREIRIQEKINKLERKLPTDVISINSEEWEVLRLLNIERAKVGDMSLTMVSPLQDACDVREIEICSTFSHTRPDGTKFNTSIPSTFKYGGAGENIYKCSTGYDTAERAMNAWMNSPGHRENMLKSGYDYIGVGLNDIGAVQIFATWNLPIVSVNTSANTMQFEDEEAMMKEYLICKSSDGIESYMPLDTEYMTKIDGGYKLNIRSTDPVIFTIGAGGKDTVVNNTEKTDANTADTDNTKSDTVNTVFEDVKQGAYYADAVKWAVDKNITTGTSKTKFSPDDTCTRAQILTFLWRAVGSPKAGSANPFSDVSESDYFYDAAVWASEKGMVTGKTFGGDTPCTRSSTVTYMWKNAGSPLATKASSFEDISSDAQYAEAVAWAVEKSVTSGTSETTFSPDEICSRGQIVTFLHRALH